MTKSYLDLSEGEGIVVQAAAEIYAAYIISGKVRNGEEKDWMKRAFKEAASFAKTVDELDDDETSGGDAKVEPSAGTSMPSRDELLEDMETASDGEDQTSEAGDMGLPPLMEEVEDAGADMDDVILEKGETSEGDAEESDGPPSAAQPPKKEAGE
jgi:hypothetical protein